MAHITLQSPGQPIADFGIAGTIITIDSVIIDCAALQSDSQVLINVAKDKAGVVKLNPKSGGTCLAIIRIPAKQYQDVPGDPDPQTGDPTVVRTEVPLDPSAIAVELWPTV